MIKPTSMGNFKILSQNKRIKLFIQEQNAIMLEHRTSAFNQFILSN